MSPAALPSKATRQRKLSALFESATPAKFFKAFVPFDHTGRARGAIYFVASFAFAALTGCSGMRIVDSQVSAFSQLQSAPEAAFKGATWTFERLPSQQQLEGAAAARQSKLEAMAEKALGDVGFARTSLPAAPPGSGVAAQPSFTAQLSARIQRLERGPFDHEPLWGPGFGLPGRDYVVTGSGRVIPVGPWPRTELPWYVREISVLLRDAKDKRVVYETQAKHEGRWADDEAVLPAMFAAALQGFPNPSAGPRMVNIEIPR
jgi:hypothetical protein